MHGHLDKAIEMFKRAAATGVSYADQLAEDDAINRARREPEAIKEVDDLLPSANPSMDAAMAHTFLEHFESFERIERIIATRENRRDDCVRD